MRPAALVTTSVLLGLAIIAWPAARSRSAAAAAARAVAFHDAAVRDAQEVMELRAAKPAISAGKRPQPNVYAHLSDALVEAGLPTQSLKEVSPGEDAAVKIVGVEGPQGAYRRQGMRVTLESLTLPQVGRFFEVWRGRQPEWTVTSIQMTPTTGRDQSKATARGPLRPLRITLVMEATYLDLPEGRSLP